MTDSIANLMNSFTETFSSPFYWMVVLNWTWCLLIQWHTCKCMIHLLGLSRHFIKNALKHQTGPVCTLKFDFHKMSVEKPGENRSQMFISNAAKSQTLQRDERKRAHCEGVLFRCRLKWSSALLFTDSLILIGLCCYGFLLKTFRHIKIGWCVFFLLYCRSKCFICAIWNFKLAIILKCLLLMWQSTNAWIFFGNRAASDFAMLFIFRNETACETRESKRKKNLPHKL